MIDAIPSPRPLYVHLDFDILRPEDAPAMLYAVPGGPSLAELVSLGAALHKTNRVAAISATAWELGSDRGGGIASAFMTALDSFLGGSS